MFLSDIFNISDSYSTAEILIHKISTVNLITIKNDTLYIYKTKIFNFLIVFCT